MSQISWHEAKGRKKGAHPSRTSLLPGSPWGPEAAFSITAATTHPVSMMPPCCNSPLLRNVSGRREKQKAVRVGSVRNHTRGRMSPKPWSCKTLTHLRLQCGHLSGLQSREPRLYSVMTSCYTLQGCLRDKTWQAASSKDIRFFSCSSDAKRSVSVI